MTTYNYFLNVFLYSSLLYGVFCALTGLQYNMWVILFVSLVVSAIYDFFAANDIQEVHTINIHQVDPEDYEDDLTCERCGSHNVKWEHDGEFYCDDCIKNVIRKDFEESFNSSMKK